MHRRALALAALALPLAAQPAARAQAAPVIAAAADLQFAIAELAQAFEAAGHGAVRVSLGATGNLARQIEQGAPFQHFLAADEAFVFRLADRGLTRDRGALYAVGRIVLFVPDGSPLRPDGTLADLREALAAGRLSRFAIASPEHAPYGRAAMQALAHAGLWEGLQRALVVGETVAQAASFAASGNAQGGIIARSLALAPQIAQRGRFAPIPEAWHEKLRQRMVLLRGAGAVAERFHAFMQGEVARAILLRHGFESPGG